MSQETAQEAIWDYFQNEGAEAFAGSQARQEFLVRQIPPRSRVLNIGAGAGNFEAAALARGLDVYSLDPSERAIGGLRERLGMGDRAQVGYSQQIPFDDEFFDAVVMSEVLEHLSGDVIAQTLCEVERILVRGGRFLGTVPAREDLAFSHVVCPQCEHHFHRWGHQQRFDANRLSTLLSARLQPRSVHERDFVTWRVLNWRGKAAALVRLLVRRLGVRRRGSNLFFMAVKP